MKYTSEIIVHTPLNDFIRKLIHTENMKHWQRGLVSYNYISGTPGNIGAKLKLVYEFGKQNLELMETLTHKNLPSEFHVMFETKDMQNIQENYFEETPEGNTKWTSENEYIPSSFKQAMLLMLMPKVFKKQTKQYLQDFKNFAEKGISVSHEKT